MENSSRFRFWPHEVERPGEQAADAGVEVCVCDAGVRIRLNDASACGEVAVQCGRAKAREQIKTA